jgi:hypothetical protein
MDSFERGVSVVVFVAVGGASADATTTRLRRAFAAGDLRIHDDADVVAFPRRLDAAGTTTRVLEDTIAVVGIDDVMVAPRRPRTSSMCDAMHGAHWNRNHEFRILFSRESHPILLSPEPWIKNG